MKFQVVESLSLLCGADETWLPSPGMPSDTPGIPQRWTREAPHVDAVAMIPPADVVPPVPAPSKHVEVNDAADMLLALSGGGQEMGTDPKPPAVAQAQVLYLLANCIVLFSECSLTCSLNCSHSAVCRMC